jgi:hypothetical protein
MVVPSDEMGDIEMTPAILDQITAIQDAACDALGADYSPSGYLETSSTHFWVARCATGAPVKPIRIR